MADIIGWFVNRATAIKEAQRIADFKSCELYVISNLESRQAPWEIHRTEPANRQFELINPRKMPRSTRL
jgi:hypothetical protein